MGKEARIGIAIVASTLVVMGLGLVGFVRATASPRGVASPPSEATIDTPTTSTPSTFEASDTSRDSAPTAGGSSVGATEEAGAMPEWVSALPRDDTPRSERITVWQKAREARADVPASMPTRGDQHPHIRQDVPQVMDRGYVGPAG